MGTVNVVWCLSSFVGAVQEAAIFRVPQQQLSQFSASPSDGNVKGCIPFLREGKHYTDQLLPTENPKVTIYEHSKNSGKKPIFRLPKVSNAIKMLIMRFFCITMSYM